MLSVPQRVWQLMLSGAKLDLISPDPQCVHITDIAHGLSRIARWNGQTQGLFPYSVAQHSLLVWALVINASVIANDCKSNEINSYDGGDRGCPWPLLDDGFRPSVSRRLQLLALLHDAPEYVIGDLIAPFKAVVGEQYKGVEKKLERCVYERFGILSTVTQSALSQVKNADSAAAYHEATCLAGFTPIQAKQFIAPSPPVLGIDISALLQPWQPNIACKQYLKVFYRIYYALSEGE